MTFWLIARWVAGIVGSYLAYVTFVMTETEEGRWQNRLENFWIVIDDKNQSAADRNKKVFRQSSLIVVSKLNSVFGRRLLSFRLIGISGSSSLASLFLLLSVGLAWLLSLISNHADKVPIKLTKEIPILYILDFGLLIVGIICVAIALSPILFRSRIWTLFSCVPPAFLLYGTVRLAVWHRASADLFAMFSALCISVVTDIVIVVLVRRSLAWIAERAETARVVIVLCLQTFACLFVLALPYKVSLFLHPERTRSPVAQGLFTLAAFNVPTAMICGALDTVLLLLAHRIFWPLVSQLTYGFAQRKMLENRKTVRTIGILLLLFAFGTGSWPSYLLEKFK